MLQKQKPRELSDKYGYASLEEVDLWALILRSGTKRQSVFSLSKQLLPVISDALSQKLPSYGLVEVLSAIPHVGNAQRHVIMGVYELLLRQRREKDFTVRFTKPSLLAEHFYQLRNKKQEYVYGVYLSPRLDIVHERLLTKGTTDSVIIDVRDVLFYAVRYRTRHFILVHNHPTGNPMPSSEDVEQTKRIYSVAQLLAMTFVDHIIIGKQGYYSFKEAKCVL